MKLKNYIQQNRTNLMTYGLVILAFIVMPVSCPVPFRAS